MGWINEAKKFARLQIEGAVLDADGRAYPVLAFGFLGEDGENLTAALVCTPTSLKALNKELARITPIVEKKARIRSLEIAKEKKLMEEEHARLKEAEDVEVSRVSNDFPEVADVPEI